MVAWLSDRIKCFNDFCWADHSSETIVIEPQLCFTAKHLHSQRELDAFDLHRDIRSCNHTSSASQRFADTALPGSHDNCMFVLKLNELNICFIREVLVTFNDRTECLDGGGFNFMRSRTTAR